MFMLVPTCCSLRNQLSIRRVKCLEAGSTITPDGPARGVVLPRDRVAGVSLQSTHSPNSENTRMKGEGAHVCRVGKDVEDAGNP